MGIILAIKDILAWKIMILTNYKKYKSIIKFKDLTVKLETSFIKFYIL